MKLMLKVIAIQLCSILLLSNSNAQSFNGYALYNLQNQNTTYLIDKDGNIAHTWSCSASCNYTVKLKPNGNIVRGTVNSSNQLNGAAIGGKVQELDPDANVVWEYTYSNSDHCSHHDLEILPNGNVILIAWEVKTTAELTQAGRSGVTSELWPTHFIELEQSGSTATIVWEWHIWDHMIQDADASKDNFGIVADHPELMDINAVSGSSGGGPGGGGGDWFHANGVGYNEALDQLAFTARFASEVFIIDHSTTTAEAASHAGGDSGKGGDFIFRWGNPANYGSTAAQTIPEAVHDPRWIEDDGRPNAGMLQFFNNSGGTGSSSVIDAITTPASGFIYTYSGGSYAPSSYDWRHECLATNSGQGASKTMSNGNVFVNVSQQYMYEVDQAGNIVWQYNASPTKAFRYECDYPGIVALLGDDPCGLLSISEETISQVELFPNPSTGIFKVDGFELGQNELTMTVVDMFGKVILHVENTLELDLTDFPDGVYFVKLNFNDEKVITKKLTTIR
ncbi:MAG: aryl-sulfate sulfotransferase [Crocinitomicaceae bacterium]|nr:aryl-sulfate sulfotransferase [Flavobacteriales bacterium]NQZ34226.1 aryl-sulfate sulfotransferase [Crocinitomicaceae bacterium]